MSTNLENAVLDLLDAISPDSTGLRDYVDAVRQALDEQNGWTVCIQEEGSTETTHVTFQKADTVEEAVELAKIECNRDWANPDEDDAQIYYDFHVLAVMRGNPDVVEWSDQ